MRTLDEAIRHCEEVAKINEKEFGLCPYPSTQCNGLSDCRCLKNGKEKGCLKCAKEHRQLAGWLKDYKRLLEKETPKLPIIKPWSPAYCPNCDEELSEHIDDGYYKHFYSLKRCLKCNQALKWGDDD